MTLPDDKRDRINQTLESLAACFRAGAYGSYLDLRLDLIGYRESRTNSYSTEHLAARLWEVLPKLRYQTIVDTDWVYVWLGVADPADPSHLAKVHLPLRLDRLGGRFVAIVQWLDALGVECYAKARFRGRWPDNLHLWMPLELVEAFIAWTEQHLQADRVPAPAFLPEYRGVGISRETRCGYHFMLAKTLHEFFVRGGIPSLYPYADWVHTYGHEALAAEACSFDQWVLCRSLWLLQSGDSPLDPERGIVHVQHQDALW